MTLRSHSLIALTALVAGLAWAAPAVAASANQVLADWRADGTIDGDYTLAELRSADAQINDQEREYTFWDEAYADAVRRLNDPDARDDPKPPPTVPPQDFDKDGDIDEKDVDTAKAKTQKLRKQRAAEGKEEDDPVSAEEPDDETEAVASSKSDGDDDGGLGWLTALLFLVPAAIIGFGAWRMQRGRRGPRRPVTAADADAPTSSFASGDDLS